MNTTEESSEYASLLASFRETERAYGGREAWERARDAGGTELDYEQWITARMPEFKAEFGDWEVAHELQVANGKSMKQAEDAIAAIRGKPLTNNETKMVAYINGDQAGKLISAAARRESNSNGFTDEQHFAMAAEIERLWRHATYVGEFFDEKHDDPNVHIKRFVVAVQQNGEVHYAAILAKKRVAHPAAHQEGAATSFTDFTCDRKQASRQVRFKRLACKSHDTRHYLSASTDL